MQHELSAEVAALRQELALSKSEADGLRAEVARLTSSWRVLRVSSPLTDVQRTHWEPDFQREDLSRAWEAWCPCCKRPLDIIAFGARDRGEVVVASAESRRPRYAYVTALWGAGTGFTLGALVLAQALVRLGTKHDLVLLHTSDVPSRCLDLLREVWTLQLVDSVHADDGLFSSGREGSRFSGVFTKLHALSLVEYDKILMLDIDLAVLDSMDALFDLPAPAALWRGEQQTVEHGFSIDGRCFFGGHDAGWLQTGGINAGVMLFAPDAVIHARALSEVRVPCHPERIAGAGPEQDYLSRLFAPDWTHLSVLYNFQIHHVFFGLESAVRNYTGVRQSDFWGIDHDWHAKEEQIATELADVRDGSELCCVNLPPHFDKLPVFMSPLSYQIVAHVGLKESMVASGPPVFTQGCPMISIRSPCGAVDGRQVQLVSDAGDTFETPESRSSLPAATNGAIESDTAGLGNMLSAEHLKATEAWFGAGFGKERCAADDKLENAKNGIVQDGTDCEVYDHCGTSISGPSPWVPPRISMNVQDVHVVHFSGVVKFWDRKLLFDEIDDEFVDRFLRQNAEVAAALWLDRSAAEEEYARFGLRCEGRRLEPLDQQLPARPLQEVLERCVIQVREVTRRAAVQWRLDLEALLRTLNFGSLLELLEKLEFGKEPFEAGDLIEVFWRDDDLWYVATVQSFLHDFVEVAFDETYEWTCTCWFHIGSVRKKSD